jgi:hypothetical protein
MPNFCAAERVFVQGTILPASLGQLPEKTILHGSKNTPLALRGRCVRVLNIDILLAVLILIFQGGQTVCGVYVTDHNRKRIVAIMIILGVLTVLVGGYVAYRSGEAQAGMINGGDSFTVAKLYSIDGNMAHLAFQQRGDYPLRQVQCTFIDGDKYNDWYIKHPPKRPEGKFPGERTYKIEWLPKFGTDTEGTLGLSKSGRNNFLFNCVAPNGYWVESVHARKVKGKWLQAYWVSRSEPKREGKSVNFANRTILSEADNDYPRKPDGSVDFDY